MTHAIRIHSNGGPEVLRWETVDLDSPAKNEIRIKHTAVGLNFIDTYIRSGLYPADLPTVLGFEAAGVVEEVGHDVKGLIKGDRVAYATGPLGAYTQQRILSADFVVKLPTVISNETAASVMLKGMTAEYLFHRTYPLQKGQTILFHAAAGGVGLIASQWAKHLGCTVIGTAGSAEKAKLAKEHGCDHVILYREENIAERVMELTDGKGVPVIYDSVGKDTFEASLECLQTRGTFVSFGQASGPISDLNLRVFAPKSLSFTRPSLFNYTKSKEELKLSAERVFEVLKTGAVKVKIGKKYPLQEADIAHRDLEARKLTGSTLLIP